MRVVFLLIPMLLFTCTASLVAQYRLSGRVHDRNSGEALQYANVWVENTHAGTTTNKRGEFVLPLAAGEYTIAVSYIGYRSTRRQISVPHAGEVEIGLAPVAIDFPEVEVTPGDNPALRIIRKAIEMKEKQKERLRNYALSSHSKLLVRAGGMNLDNAEAGETVTIKGSSDGDSSKTDTVHTRLPIILETQTDAFWAAPDRYKEVVVARKQSAIIPAQSNILISAFFVTDFSRDELNFSNKAPIVGPISNAGLDAYYYRLTGTTMIDSTKIYQIDISPLRDSDPLLHGTLYIADGSYALSMVDVKLNDAALPQLFDTLAFRQNFRLVDNAFWMPADVVIDADITIPVFGIEVGIEGFSVMQDYRINQDIDEDFFDRTRIKVLKEADERDSTWWMNTQKIPSSDDERRAYVVFDSIKVSMDSTRYKVTAGTVFMSGVTGSDETQFSYPGLFTLYHYNRVEGHALSGRFAMYQPERLFNRAHAGLGYGTADKRLKYDVGAGLRLFDSPALSIEAKRYYKRDHIGSDVDNATDGFVTMLAWFSNFEYRDYFYRDGWNVDLRYDPWLLFPMRISLARDGFYNASKNSDWSLFGGDKSYKDNPPINEGSVLSVAGTVSIDARDFLDNAGSITRIGRRNHIPTFGAGWHRLDIEGRTWELRSYSARLDGSFDLGRPGVFRYVATGDHADGALPTQMLYNLQGGLEYLAVGGGFRTLDFREFGGDTRVTLGLNYSFRDWLFRWLRVPWVSDMGWELELFANGGWTRLTEATRALQRVNIGEARRPYWEAGFGIGGLLGLFRLDFTWRMNHFREGRNFGVTLGSSIFLE